MIIKSIELADYRNYGCLSLEFDRGTNILYGDNAQGKTNILEAIFVAATTKSHKGAKDREIIAFGKEEAHIRTYLEKEGVELPPMETPDLYVGILGAEARARAYRLVNEIRSHGLIVETDYMDRSVKAQMKYANKIGAKKVVIIGENELEKDAANVKDMATGEQTEVKLSELPKLFV